MYTTRDLVREDFLGAFQLPSPFLRAFFPFVNVCVAARIFFLIFETHGLPEYLRAVGGSLLCVPLFPIVLPRTLLSVLSSTK